jgi:uncharacterized membrane protein YkvA (DUF1232 family)
MNDMSLIPDDRMPETFWRKLRRVAGRVPFSEDLAAAWFCALDARTPVRVRATLMAAAAYFVLPTDMVPDFLVGFGFTDDAAVLATTIGMVGAHINEQHRRRARESLLRSDTPNDFEEGVAS